MLNYKAELEEFKQRRQDAIPRNRDYFIARQAMRHVYSWPVKWPAYKEKVMLPLVRKSVLTHANFLMGRGFTTGVVPLGTGASQRTAAQSAEKALFKGVDRCNGWTSLWRAAQVGSNLGTSGFKVYKKNVDGKELAWFSPIQPEFIFPQAAGDDYSELTKVFYAYSIDRLEAARQYGGSPDSYKSEREVYDTYQEGKYVNPDAIARMSPTVQERRIPVLEVWTDNDYLLTVGGRIVENDTNPYKRIPYVVIPNIDSGEGPEGLSDVDALVAVNNQTGLNNHLNWLLSDNFYVLRRLADPTLIWEMPPPNSADVIAGIIGGGGMLPSRLGGKIYYLAYPGQPQDMALMMDRLRAAGIEVVGLNETAFSGQSQGSIQTGPSLEINFTNVLSTLSAKQKQWEVGLKRLNSMMLKLMSDEGDIGVVDNPSATTRAQRSMQLNGRKDVGAHREVKITWPGLLPKDDMAAAQLELQKHQQGVQSIYTTLENLGFDFPDDELERIRQEMQDENLHPQQQANLGRAQAALQTAQAKQDQVAQAAQGQQDQSGAAGPAMPPDMGQLTNTPPDVGTQPDGTMVNDQGQVMDELSQRLAQMRADRIRSQYPLDMSQGGPTEATPPEAA